MRAVIESIRSVEEKPPPPSSQPPRRKNSGGNVATPMAAIMMEPEQLEDLAKKTLANTERALQELQDELRRMAGRVVGSDYSYPKAGDGTDYHNMYSLAPASIDAAVAAAASSGSGSSSSSGSSSGSFSSSCEERIK